MSLSVITLLVVVGAALLPGGLATAQPSEPEHVEVELRLDTGWVDNHASRRAVIATHVIDAPPAPWLRLHFDEAILGASTAGGQPTVLRVTSLFDGASQALNALHLRQWRNTSAFFNGHRLLLEIIADPHAQPSRVAISTATVGSGPPPLPRTLCGNDDRELSYDGRVGRIFPTICTAWMIDDVAHCFLTAGHCIDAGSDVVEFNVPLSDENGNVQHPGPEDQYPVDVRSIQSVYVGIGNDWAYFGCFPNTESGLSPAEVQGGWFVRAATPPPLEDQMIRVTGYGSTEPPVPWEWWKVQKTHVGPYVQRTATYVRYAVDTTGGNSGSPVVDETTGLAIAIHTNGGCTNTGGANYGTSIDNAGLAAAWATPLGVCAPMTCPADITGSTDGVPDGNVDALDFLRLVSQWGTPCSAPCDADITGPIPLIPDNAVDALDALLMIAQWGSPGNCP